MFRDCDTFSAVSDYKECAGIAIIVLRELSSGNKLTNAWVISHSQVWLNAQNATDAPENDLMLWKSLNLCEKYEPGVLKAGLLTFSRHLWYLTEEAVTYFLFSKKVSDSEKKISESLIKYKANEKSLPTGVPIFCFQLYRKTASIGWTEVMVDFSFIETRWILVEK
ncbi:hypothetical protein AVEN_135781-1 [Araneus ventricosus]|uniref:Uncharacterized protein n=1 Tax=Araneus ventricosus TaxID=182803 RepID=A0A4Y2CBW4_ARAVE|nr:hypothetical protein AVEN_135781-1 [Araneus ventricosus]